MRSRIVAWLGVLLPLAALAILSTMFLLGRRPDPDAAIPYARVDANELARDPRMTRPAFAGVTTGGAAVTLTASRASPDPGRAAEAEDLRLTWRATDGLAADLAAPAAKIEGERIVLSGGVRMTTSGGWALSLQDAQADTANDVILGQGDIVAVAPFGRISAQDMRLDRGPDGQYVLNLKGDVRLIYQP